MATKKKRASKKPRKAARSRVTPDARLASLEKRQEHHKGRRGKLEHRKRRLLAAVERIEHHLHLADAQLNVIAAEIREHKIRK